MIVTLIKIPSKSESSGLEEASNYVAVPSHQSSSWLQWASCYPDVNEQPEDEAFKDPEKETTDKIPSTLLGLNSILLRKAIWHYIIIYNFSHIYNYIHIFSNVE